MNRAAPASPPATRLLRGCVLVTALAAVWALGSSGLVAAPAAALLMLLVVAAGAAPDLFSSPEAARVRRVVSAVAIAAAAVGALVIDRSLDSDAAIANLPVQLGTRLALLAAGLLVAQLLLGDRQREVLVSLLVCAGLFVFALAAGPGVATGIALVVAWPAAVTALVVAHAERQRASADVRATTVGRPDRLAVNGSSLATVVVGSAVVALLVVLLAPHPQGLQPGRRGPAGGAGSDGAASGREVSAYTNGLLDLRTRGQLPATPVADVPVDSPSLWLGATLAIYDGTTWRSPSPGVILGPALPGGPPYVLAPDPHDVVGPARVDRLRPREGFGGVLLAPGHPLQLDVQNAQVMPISGGYFIAPASSTNGSYPSSYAVASRSTEPVAATLRAVPRGQLAAPVPDVYTALPATVPERVRVLGRRLTAGTSTRYDATLAVERYLRQHATYRLDSPVPPPGADAVDHFLFSARTGFCEQFASAEVVLLRAAGIPARLATGFSGGTEEGGRRTVRGSDAHAWVEVLYPGVGWASSDPTAGTRLDQGTSLLDRVRQLLRDATGRAVLAGIVLAASLLGWGLAWLTGWWLRRRRTRRMTIADAPVVAAFGRLESALARTGAPRAPSESVRELAGRTGLAPVASALAVLERTCYSAQLPAPAETDAAVRELDEMTRRLLADA
jgi:transglutaminase-like putative cysteine protease